MKTILPGLFRFVRNALKDVSLSRSLFFFAGVILLAGALGSRADETVILHGVDLISCEVNGTGGNDINNAAFLPMPSSLSDANGVTNAVMLVWKCFAFEEYQYFIGPDADNYFGLGGASDGWYDAAGSLANNVIWNPGRGMVLEVPAGAPVAITLFGTAISTPTVPPTNYCGCDMYSLIGPQDPSLTSYQDVTGMAPVNGSQVYRYNSGQPYPFQTPNFTIYTYNNGVWSPGDPTLPSTNGEAAVYYIPCATNQCITMSCTGDKTVHCGIAWNFDAPTNIVDTCCTNFTVNFSVVTNSFGCPLVVVGTWLVSDDCGNSNSCSQTVTVTSTPIISCRPDKTIPCTATVIFNPPLIITNACCGTNFYVSIYGSDVVTNLGNCSYATTRTWLITDCCGETNFCHQTITVTNAPPSISCVPDKTIPCSSVLIFNPPHVNSACCSNISIITFGGDVTNILGLCSYSVTRTWRITDCCDHTNFCHQTITVRDTNAPALQCPSNIVLTACASIPVFYNATAVDDCCTNVTITFTPPSGSPFGPGTVTTVHVVATDCCSNSTSCDFTVTINPSTSTNCCCDNCNPPYPICYTNIIYVGFNFLVNHLCQGTNDTLGDVLHGVGDGTELLKWNVASQSYTDVAFYDAGSSTWYDTISSNPSTATLKPGEAFVLDNPGPQYNLVICGCEANCPLPCLPPTNGYVLVGRFDVGTAAWTNLSSCPPQCGTEVLIWNPVTQSFSTDVYRNGAWTPQDPILGIGQSAFVHLVPCTNCINMDCANDKAVPCNFSWNFDAPSNIVDNCCTNFSVVVSTVTNSANCPLVVTRTWWVIDTCGNSNHCQQTITVTNTSTIINCSADKTISCTSALVFDAPTATNGCCTNISISVFGSDVVTNLSACTHTVTRTWLIADCCSSNFCHQTVTVVDNTPPMINCVTNKTVLCTSNWSFDMPTASDACCTNVTISVLSTVTISNCPTVIRRTWVATDCCNNTNTCSQTVTVLTCVPPPDGMVGWWPGDGNANDIIGGNNGSMVGGAAFNAGMVDQGFNFTGTGQSVTVPTAPALDITGAITVDAWINPSAINARFPIVTKATAGTPDGYYFDLSFGKVRFLVGNAGSITPSGAFLVSSHIVIPNQWSHVAATYDGAMIKLYINGVLDTNMPFSDPFPGPNGQPLLIGNATGSIEYFLGGIDEVELFNRVLSSNEIAAIYAAGPAGKCKTPCLVCATNKTVPCGAAWSFDPPTVTPPCGNTNYSLTVFQTVTNAGCPPMITRTWLFVDGCGHSNTCSQTVTLTGGLSIITCPPGKTISCTGTPIFDLPVVTNACCTNIIISVFGSDVTNHFGSCAYSITRNWHIVDCCTTNICSQTILVTNTPPIIICNPGKTISCNAALIFNPPSVTNTCCTNISISIFGTDVTTNLNSCARAVTRTWLITDCCGDTNFCQQTITVTNTPPIINCNPDKSIPCTSALVFNPPGVTNGCCTNVSITIFGVDATNILGACSYSVTRTWRIVDCCYTNFCQQKITVTNTPMVVTCPVDKFIPCNSNVVFNLPLVTSFCRTNAITVISNLTTVIGPCTNVFTRYWRITDGCTTNICHQSVTVTHPPPLLTGITTKTNPCGTAIIWTTPTAVDPCCSTNLTVQVLRTVTNSFNPLVVTRTWIATNCCGLTNSFSEKITTLQSPPPNDNCSGAIQIFAGIDQCGSTLCATASMIGTLSPTPCGSSANSPDVWYKFITGCGGTVTFDTCQTNCAGTANFDTVLSVYTGVCGTLTQVQGPSCNDNSCGSQSKVILTNLTPCTVYYIRVAGHNNAIGNFRLRVTEATTTPPVNDHCANATTIVNGTYSFRNCGADTDGPNTGTNCPSFNDVWFRYTATCNGQVWVETCNSCIGTVLSVYTGTCSVKTLVGCNAQATQGRCVGGTSSFVQFNATSGTTYLIRVGSAVNGDTGSGYLTVNGPYPTVGTCPPSGACTWRFFTVVGNGNNTPWAWSIQAPCCANIQVTNVPGVTGNASALATAFVNSINGVGCAGLHAQTAFGPFGLFPGRFRVCLSCNNWVFRVGGAGSPEQNQCVVPYSSQLGPAGPCVFNPEMFELDLSGHDLNTNDVDDAIDILDGISLDMDQDGIPDEVQSCVMPIFTDYPESQVVPPGTNMILSATASGTGPLTYQWYLNGSPVVDNTNVTGGSSNILTILSVGTENLGEYTVVASNDCGMDTSAPADLSVYTVMSPIIAGHDSGDGTFHFSFPTQLGVTYVVEYTEDVTSTDWTPLETVEGDGDARDAVDPSPDAPNRFYRVRSIDPP